MNWEISTKIISLIRKIVLLNILQSCSNIIILETGMVIGNQIFTWKKFAQYLSAEIWFCCLTQDLENSLIQSFYGAGLVYSMQYSLPSSTVTKPIFFSIAMKSFCLSYKDFIFSNFYASLSEKCCINFGFMRQLVIFSQLALRFRQKFG